MNHIQNFLEKNILPTNLQDLKDEITAIINSKTLPIVRKLEKLKAIKTIMIPAFATTKKKFFTEGTNDHGLKIGFYGKFKEEILAHIPAELNFAGGSVDSLELTENMWDSAIINELGNPAPISIKEWAEKTASLIINCKSDIKTNGYANIQYVKASDGRTVVVDAGLAGGGWEFRCYELDEDSYWFADALVLSPAMVAAK